MNHNLPYPEIRRAGALDVAGIKILTPVLIFGVFAVALGWQTWGPWGLFWKVLLLPFLYGLAPNVQTRISLIAGYFLGAFWAMIPVFDAFWPAYAPWVGIGGWMGSVLIVALPWWVAALFTRGNQRLLTAFGLSVVMTSIPPFGAWGLASPLISAGYYFPGMGISGLFLDLILLLVFVAAGQIFRQIFDAYSRAAFIGKTSIGLPIAIGTAIILMLAISLSCNLFYAPVASPVPAFGVQTNLPGQKGAPSFFVMLHRDEQVARIGEAAVRRDPPGSWILFPENTLGFYYPNLFSNSILRPLLTAAEKSGDTLLIGSDDSTDKGYWDALNVYAPHGSFVLPARQPIPLGEWRPWQGHSAIASWWSFGPSQINGEPVALSMCYEELLVWPTAWSFIGAEQKPVLMLAPQDHDWEKGRTEARIQENALRAWSRLFNTPVLQADNVPRRA